MDRPFVEISGVAMRYGGVEGTLALRDATLSVGKGEFIPVVGPSGCGKSTLMRLVTGLWPATAGNVLVAGREVAGPLSIAGMAFQNPTLLPWRNIIDNVMLPCRFSAARRGRAEAAARDLHGSAAELLTKVGLNDSLWSRPASTLSVGQQQRVAAARALIGSPQVIIADEPTSALDNALRDTFLDLLLGACREARTTLVFVSHDERLSDRFDTRLALGEINRLREEAPAEERV